MINVDSGIERPSQRSGKGGLYPWGDMNIDESFFSDMNMRNQQGHANIRYAPKKFSVRSWTTPEGVHGWRVWRVE